MIGWRRAVTLAAAGALASAAGATSASAQAGPVGATTAQSPAFSGKTAVGEVEASCITGARHRNRVLLAVTVRYSDASAAAARRYANGRHTVRSTATVLGAGGMALARDRDRGRAQVAIRSLKGYRHVHHHLLSAAQSRRVLDGRSCRAAALEPVTVRVRATQQLATRGRASSAATATQGDTATATASLDPIQGIPTNINGCLRAGDDWNCHGVNLDGQNLSGAILAYGDFSFASLVNANLSKARLGHVIMNQTILDGANMQGALFGSASLTSASLIDTDLTGAVGPFANLGNAKFGQAKLVGANLSAANLQGTDFGSSTCDANTRFPAAFPHRCVDGVIAP